MAAYPLFPHRRVLLLNGVWEFHWAGNTGLEEIDPAALRYDEAASVPGAFDLSPIRYGARGVGVYRRRIVWPSDDALLRLEIGALGLRGKVWWDGRKLGTPDLPYSRFAFDVPDVKAGTHEVVIAVDNRFDPERSPLFAASSDFYAYGGIYRDVTLTSMPPLRIERVVVRTLSIVAGTVALEIGLAGEAIPSDVALRVAFDGGCGEDVVVRPDGGRVVLERSVPRPMEWTPDHPNLHTVEVGIADDSIVERFGLRTVEARDGAILLNGEPIRLKGVNRHEAHPQLGPVQPTQMLLDDLLLIKDLGCNFIRAVHYPHTPEFFDLCDKLGLLVWTESLAWGLDAACLARETTRMQLLRQTAQMVEENINHPSTILFGFLNECASDSADVGSLYADLVATIRERDRTRLVSYASNRPDGDLYFGLVDVVSVNLYPGWIYPTSAWPVSSVDMIRPCVERVADLLKRPELAGKPLLMSEIGACALYGCHDRVAAQWSEEYQAGYMAEACRAVLDDPRWAGVTFWQFCDSRSYVDYGEVRCKPRGFNCAGLFDEYRRPKLSAEAVRTEFRQR